MRYRIAMWAGVGFLVAGCWALLVFVTFPNANEWMRHLWLLAAVTCPITLIRHVPISLYQVLAANTATYALLGLAIEIFARQRRQSVPA